MSLEKPYSEMNDSELCTALRDWEGHVKTASGWASVYFAATQVKSIVTEGNRRNLGFVNRYPIQRVQEPVRAFQDTFSAETVVMDTYFTGSKKGGLK